MLAAVTAVSSAAVVILLAAPLSALTIGAGRVTVTGLGLLLLGRRRLRGTFGALRAGLGPRTALAAALLAVHFGTWIASLSLTSVVRSVTIVATQPLLAGFLARGLGDRVSWRLYVGGAIALAGTAIMVGVEPATSGPSSAWGDGLALVAAAAAAGYLAVGRSVREHVDLAGYLAVVHLGAGALLVLTVLVTGLPWATGPVGVDHLAAVVYLGLVPGIIGHGLLNWAVRHLPVHTVSLAILVEPVGATALAVLVLDHVIRGADVAGGLVILLGVAFAMVGRDDAAITRPPGRRWARFVRR
jgi:drug/metabolite transporter (DMT)-like permease